MPTGEFERFADIPDPVRGPPPPAPPPAVPAEPSPTRAQSARRRWAAAALAAAWIAALLAAHLGLRDDLFRAPVLLQLAVWTVAVPAGLALALRPRKLTGWPPGVTAVRAGLAVLLVAFGGLAMIPMTGPTVPLAYRTVSGCLSFAFVLALPALVGAVLVLRGAFLNAPALRGALVGAVCGLAGTTGIHAHCPVVSPSHVLLAHGLPVVVLAAAGALLGARRGRA